MIAGWATSRPLFSILSYYLSHCRTHLSHPSFRFLFLMLYILRTAFYDQFFLYILHCFIPKPVRSSADPPPPLSLSLSLSLSIYLSIYLSIFISSSLPPFQTRRSAVLFAYSHDRSIFHRELKRLDLYLEPLTRQIPPVRFTDGYTCRMKDGGTWHVTWKKVLILFLKRL